MTLANPTMVPDPGSVLIRMYCQILGDCFLLAFPAQPRPVFMLIDCGVFNGTPNLSDMMKRVAEDIAAATGGRIDVVVTTHEHYDHLVGYRFAQQKVIFKDIEFGVVWASWLSNISDPEASSLRLQYTELANALQLAVPRMRGIAPDVTERIETVLAGSGALVRADMDYVISKSKNKTAQYFEAGKLLGFPDLPSSANVPNVPNVRIYTLGPPKGDLLTLPSSMEPSADWTAYGEAKSKEKKKKKDGDAPAPDPDHPMKLATNTAFVNALLGLEASDDEAEALQLNLFDASFRLDAKAAAQNGFFKQRYGFRGRGGADNPAWRRIDQSWLLAAAELAAHLDDYMNNSSFAFAIELVNPNDEDKNRVLLFPADAQVGNWRSWHDLKWQVNNKPVGITDLFAKTVFYKVGHHGSYNATLKDKGLEMMTHEDLVAMIPVDQDKADGKGYDMPLETLRKRLMELCKGRVYRGDTGLPAKPPTDVLTTSEWNKFKKQATASPDVGHITIQKDELTLKDEAKTVVPRTKALYVQHKVLFP